MDYVRPVEAVIPGATGRILAAVGRMEVELSVSTLADIAGVGRTRASRIVGELSALGIVERREVGLTVLVSLADRARPGNSSIASATLARRRSLGCTRSPPRTNRPRKCCWSSDRLREARPTPAATSMCWPYARRQPTPKRGRPRCLPSTKQAQALAGNRVQLLDYDLGELRLEAGPKTKGGRESWRAVRRDALVLVGSQFENLIGGSR